MAVRLQNQVALVHASDRDRLALAEDEIARLRTDLAAL
jgi:hypothetical protein